MNKIKSLPLLSLSLFFAVFFMNPITAFSEEAVGKVIGVIGKVEFSKGTEWKTVSFQQSVYAKDEFRTAKRSRVKILFNDNSLMALGPNSALKVESYLYKPKEKLRQGLIGVAHGLSMYIVNKSQNNKSSSFRILSPTANIAARGTQGYVSSSSGKTLLANQVGMVDASNKNPDIKGNVLVGAMMKTVIPKDAPPLRPTPLQENELEEIRKTVIGVVQLDALTSRRDVGRKSSDKSKDDDEADDESESDSQDNGSDRESSKKKDSDKRSSDNRDQNNDRQDPPNQSSDNGNTQDGGGSNADSTQNSSDRQRNSGDSNQRTSDNQRNSRDSNQGPSDRPRNSGDSNHGSSYTSQSGGDSSNRRQNDTNTSSNADFSGFDFTANTDNLGDNERSSSSNDFQGINRPYDPSMLDSCQD